MTLQSIETRSTHDEVARFEELVAAHEGAARHAIRGVLGYSSAVEEDLVQEALLRLLVRVRQDTAFQPGRWLWRVAHNLAVDEVRRRQPVPTTDEVLEACIGQVPEAEVSDVVDKVVLVLNRLPERQRRALLTQMGDDPPRGKELAAVLEVSESGARSLMARARRNLRRRLGEFDCEGPDR